MQRAVNAEPQAAQGWAGAGGRGSGGRLWRSALEAESILEPASENTVQTKLWTWVHVHLCGKQKIMSTQGAQWAVLMNWEGGWAQVLGRRVLCAGHWG